MVMILSLQRLLQAATAVAAGRSDAELRADVDALESEAMSRFREWVTSMNGTDRLIQGEKRTACDEVEGRLNQSLNELYGRKTKSMIADLHTQYDNAPIGEVEAAYQSVYSSIGIGSMGIPQNPRGNELWRQQDLQIAKANELRQIIQSKKTK